MNNPQLILSSRMIREDCDLLDQLQSTFPSLKIILADDTTPYIHLYKNEDEAFTFNADHFRENITKHEYDNLLTFNVEEKIAILMNTLNLYLIGKGYDETKPYILFFCGTYVTQHIRNLQVDDGVDPFMADPEFNTTIYKITTRFKLLEVK